MKGTSIMRQILTLKMKQKLKFDKTKGTHLEHEEVDKVGYFKIVYLNGFPWLNPKLELTIIATQKAIKITRNTISLHFLLCLMIPPIWPPSLDGYLPMTAPKAPLISHTLYLSTTLVRQLDGE